MAVDDVDNLYLSFVYGNKNIFVAKIGSIAEVDTVSDSALAWPAIDITEGNMYLTYAKRTPSDSVVLRKWRCVGDTFWRGTDTLFKGSVKGITTSSGVYTLINTLDNKAKLVTYNPLFKTTATEEMADSVYNPHVYLSRLSSKHLAFEWTALSGSNYYVTSHRAECDDILPVIYFECGAEATPYTTYRSSTRDFGAYSVDCGNDSLVYTLDGLETSLDYNLALEFFYDDTNETKSFVVTVGSETDTVTVADSTLTRYNFVIESPSATMRVKITGADAVLARLILYESDGSTQGYYSRGEEEGPSDPKPLEFRLDNVMPNPFTKTATISFAIPLAEPVTLKVYDVTGREVRTLVNGPVAAGVHSVNWDARDNQARPLASGVYFVRMATKDFNASRKAVLLK